MKRDHGGVLNLKTVGRLMSEGKDGYLLSLLFFYSLYISSIIILYSSFLLYINNLSAFKMYSFYISPLREKRVAEIFESDTEAKLT